MQFANRRPLVTVGDMAKSFREISGARKTPESLCWLIKHRQWLDDRIRRLEKALPASPDLAPLREQLAAIDTAMRLHEIQVDLTLLKPVRKNAALIAPYGAMKRQVLAYLRRNRGAPRAAVLVTVFVRDALKLDVRDTERIHRRVVQELHQLRREGLVTKLSATGKFRDVAARWQLSARGAR